MQHLIDIDRQQLRDAQEKNYKQQIEHDLRALGADRYDLVLPETHSLPFIIHPGERIGGVVYGRYKVEGRTGRGALVVTAHRLLFIDRKPLFIRCDEISFEVLSGISYIQAGIGGTITLSTRMGNIGIRTFNLNCARTFIKAIEAQIFRD